jgi:flagellar basal-body rod protein FlgB
MLPVAIGNSCRSRGATRHQHNSPNRFPPHGAPPTSRAARGTQLAFAVRTIATALAPTTQLIMLSTLFCNTSIPVLEQVVQFTEARHGVLAGNIANLDTPGYKTRDLSPELFQSKLQEAIETSRMQPQSQTYGYGQYSYTGPNGTIQNIDASPAMPQIGQVDRNLAAFDKVKDSYKAILRHDGVDVSMENQINEIVKNQTEHNLAAGILSNQFRLLRAAISERAA